MKKVVVLLCSLGASMLSMTAMAEDQIIRLPDCGCLTTEDLHELAMYAYTSRGYSIEENTPTLIVGEQDGLKVDVLIQSNHEILIRWKEGFGHRSDRWLRNLKTDILWRLAE